MDYGFNIALNMYRNLTGDYDTVFDTTEDIYTEIDKNFDSGDGLVNVESLDVNITDNGTYTYEKTLEIDGYNPVRVNVELNTETYYQNGYNDGYGVGEDVGYGNGVTAGKDEQKALLEETTFNDNGVYEKEDGWKRVSVEVDIPTFETETLSVELTDNGNYSYTPTKDGFGSVDVTVNVPTGGGGDSGKPKIYNGFRFTGGDLSKVDFSQYDWSGVYDCSYLLAECDLTNMDWEHFKSNFNGRILAAEYMLRSNTSSNGTNKYLYTLPNLGEMTKDCVSLRYLCAYNQYMTDVSNIQYWNTSKVTTMSSMFYYCRALTSVPLFDTSNVTDMSYTFYGCSKLTSVPLFDTSKVTNMSQMLRDCLSLVTVPLFDTSNVTDMSYTFYGCSKLTSVPLFDTSNVTTMSNMFRDCDVLTSVPEFDTSKVTAMNEMFQYCGALTSVPLFDTSNVTTMSSMFYSCSKLTTLGGFTNMGMQSSFTAPDLSVSTLLTKESIMNVINNLYDRKSAGYATKTLKFGSTNLVKITDEEKAIATNKGWTLS